MDSDRHNERARPAAHALVAEAAGFEFPRVSAVALVAANLVPLVGVVFVGWRMFPILLLYSLENIVIGFYNLLRMLKAPCDLKELARTSEGIPIHKAGLIGFFCFHYGMFVGIHLLFVIVLFGSGAIDQMLSGSAGREAGAGPPIGSLQIPWIGLAVVSLLVSHGVSFVRNFLGEKEYARVTCNKLFMQPYARVMVMHVTIVLGAFATMVMGTPLAVLILFVLLKTGVDLVAHVRERKKFRSSSP